MEIIIIIVVAIIFIRQNSKIDKLTRDVANLQSRPQSRPEMVAKETPATVVAQEAPHRERADLAPQDVPKAMSPSNMSPAPSAEDAWADRAVEWLKKDFMVKLGAFLLLLALGWFVSYAFMNDWIGPVGRITLGLLTGVTLLVLGTWRITTHPHQGGIFAAVGSTTILFTLFAARSLYDFFTPESALFMMALSVVYVAFLSVRYHRNALALAGLVLASVAPYLTSAPTNDLFVLFTYLLIVVFGTLWVVYLRGWSNLTFTALIVVFLHGLPFLGFGLASGDRDIALLFAFVFTAIFFVANILGLIANESEENRMAHIAIAIGTGLYLIVWIAGAAEPEWQSLLYVMWMLVFSVGSYIVYRVIESRVPFYIYGATSVALLAAATAAELEGSVLTIAFTIETAILVLLVGTLLRNVSIAQRTALLFAAPILMSLPSFTTYLWGDTVLNEHFFVLTILGLSLAVIGHFLTEQMPKASEDRWYGGTLTAIGAFYGLALIWLVLHVPAVMGGWSATMVSLIIYTIIGITAYIHGKREQKRGLALGGAVLLGAVIARLLLVEVWQMDIVGRIVTFLVIGSLLMSTAFVRRNRGGTTDEALTTDKHI